MLKGYTDMSEENRIFPRNCFNCGKPMSLNKDTGFLWCTECDVCEDGTMTGRFNIPLPATSGDEQRITFIDHSKVYVPSPDVTGR